MANRLKSSDEEIQRASELVDRLKTHGTPDTKGIVDQVVTHDELQWLIDRASALFLKESSLLEADPPLIICGDTHGQFTDVLRIFSTFGWPIDGVSRYLFLGDYVDRGKQSIEVMFLMFALKVQCPNDVYLLRGNHETWRTNARYGFHKEVMERYASVAVFAWSNAVFDCLPIAGLVGQRILCMHGGLSPDLESLDQIRRIKRPLNEPPEKGLIADLLWSDPKPGVDGFQPNVERKTSCVFGEDAVMDAVEKLAVDLIVRAHQVVPGGYEFFAGNHLITVFSAPDYCDKLNTAGFLFVDKEMACSVKQIVPMIPFIGRFKLDKSENFDEYMKALGVGFMTRKIGNAIKNTFEITIKGEQWTLKTISTFKTVELKFQLGVEFDDVSMDGRKVKTTMTIKRHKWIQTQKATKSDEKNSDVIYEVATSMTSLLEKHKDKSNVILVTHGTTMDAIARGLLGQEAAEQMNALGSMFPFCSLAVFEEQEEDDRRRHALHHLPRLQQRPQSIVMAV